MIIAYISASIRRRSFPFRRNILKVKGSYTEAAGHLDPYARSKLKHGTLRD